MLQNRLIRQTVKIGFFTLLAIFILYLGITYLKGPSIAGFPKTYYVSMNDVMGVNVATRVFADDYKVGSVREIEYDYTHNGKAVLTLTLDPKVQPSQGTTVQVAQTFLSGTIVNLLLPALETGAYLHAKDTIPMSTERSVMSLEQLQSEFAPRISAMLSRMDSALLQANTILSNPNIESALADVRQSAQHINASSAQLQRPLSSLPKIMERIDHISASVESFASRLGSLHLQETMSNLESTSCELKDFTQRLNQSNGTVGRLLNESGLYNRIDNVTTSFDALIRDIKANPKKYVKLSFF